MKPEKQAVRWLLILSAAALALVGLGVILANTRQPKEDDKGLKILDREGTVLVTAASRSALYDAEQWAYLELALEEAAAAVAQRENCTEAEAEQRLFRDEYSIYTAFDKAAYEALGAVETTLGDAQDAAAVLTDLQGNILAVRSTDPTNYAKERRSPCSAFKTLSVYVPALEKGTVNWSTLYEDSPYKQLQSDDGSVQDWPLNATRTYSLEQRTVYEALRTSLNTVAVKCLADVGVQSSMEFLQTNFGIPLKEEQHLLETYGQEEVIGNIALGYLETGITPVEMAGYYQIFANGGVYTQPRTVVKILDGDGMPVHFEKPEQKQVIRPETADTMCKLLQGVVSGGGTGADARCPDVEVAGKTGTGDQYADNWFVGITPGYSLTVWHGQSDSNHAEEAFAAAVQSFYELRPEENRKFVTHKNLTQLAYCIHSGKAFSEHCSLIETGYFENADTLPVCVVCGNNQQTGGSNNE